MIITSSSTATTTHACKQNRVKLLLSYQVQVKTFTSLHTTRGPALSHRLRTLAIGSTEKKKTVHSFEVKVSYKVSKNQGRLEYLFVCFRINTNLYKQQAYQGCPGATISCTKQLLIYFFIQHFFLAKTLLHHLPQKTTIKIIFLFYQ